MAFSLSNSYDNYTPSDIHVKAYDPFVFVEGDASEAITPGHLVERGGSDDFQKHNTAGGTAQKMFAINDYEFGEDISTDLTSGENMKVWIPRRGDVVYAFVTGDFSSISKGDFLVSHGDGTLEPESADSGGVSAEAIVGQALEAVTTNGNDSRVQVEVM